MPFSDPERHLHDILESIDLIREFIRDMDFSSYQRDEKTKPQSNARYKFSLRRS
jgi:uncharacterized protein with HEPN domain